MINTIKLLCLSLLLTLGFASASQAQTSPVQWTFQVVKTKIKGQYKLVADAKLNAGWSIYSQFISDEGPVPTAFEYELPDGFTLVEETKEYSEHKTEGMDDIFQMNLIKYKKEVSFQQTFNGKSKKEIKGNVTFMVCNDETCLPPTTVPFKVKIK